MTTVFEASALPTAELTESVLGLPSAQPIGDAPIVVRSAVKFKSADGKVISGVWECEPGASRWEFDARGELVTVLSGRMTVQEDGGEPAEVSAGFTAYFPLGWRGVWTVHETLRKVYVVYKPEIAGWDCLRRSGLRHIGSDIAGTGSNDGGLPLRAVPTEYH